MEEEYKKRPWVIQLGLLHPGPDTKKGVEDPNYLPN